MLSTKLINHIRQLENLRLILRNGNVLPHMSVTSKRSIANVKIKIRSEVNDNVDELDKPIKFSTSKAAKFPAAYDRVEAESVPWYHDMVVSLSLMVFMLYFFVLRQENDIDQKMVENIPNDILVQIYGKENAKKYLK